MTQNSPFSANPRPKGRPKGNRAKLAQRYFEDLYHAWEEQGESVIARAMFQDPVAVLGIIGRLMPQKLEITTPTDGMSDERLAEMLDMAERMAALKAGVTIDGSAMVVDGDAAPAALPGPDAPLPDENGDSGVALQTPGEGALCREGGAGINIQPTTPSRPENSGGFPPEKTNALNIPHPVGRAVPLDDATVERRNIAKLEDDLDPEALF